MMCLRLVWDSSNSQALNRKSQLDSYCPVDCTTARVEVALPGFCTADVAHFGLQRRPGRINHSGGDPVHQQEIISSPCLPARFQNRPSQFMKKLMAEVPEAKLPQTTEDAALARTKAVGELETVTYA